MIECRMCDKEVAPSAKACPHCGAKHPNITSFRARGLLGIVACAFASVVFISTAFSQGTDGTEKWVFLIGGLFFVGGVIYGVTELLSGKDGD